MRVKDRRSARESSWKHWDGLRCLGNSIYSTLLETQQILLRHLQNIVKEFGRLEHEFCFAYLFNYNLKYHYFYIFKRHPKYAWMHEWLNEWMERWMDGDGWMEGDGWMGGWMDEWMDG